MQYIYQFSNLTNYPSIPQEISHVLGYNLRTSLGVLSFFGIGLGVIVGASFLAYDTQKRIQTSVEVEGTVIDPKVIEARVSRPRGGSSMGYTVVVTYSYKLDGKTYQSDIYPGGRSTNQAGKTREAASYVIGSTRHLSVNPSTPQEISHVLAYNLRKTL